MVEKKHQNDLLIQIDASSFAEFEISEFEIARVDCCRDGDGTVVGLVMLGFAAGSLQGGCVVLLQHRKRRQINTNMYSVLFIGIHF